MFARLVYAGGLAVLLSLEWGCAGGLLQIAMNKDINLTPEQIKAYQETGHKVFFCFTVGGPPPVGNTTILVVPQTVNPVFNFGSNCTLIQGLVDQPSPTIRMGTPNYNDSMPKATIP